jgi:uncharacterized coiled-coil DUF342 family protein
MTLEDLKKQRDELNDKASQLFDEGRESTGRVKKLRFELRDAKGKRDVENAAVKDLKAKRDEVNKKIKAKVGELNKLQAEIGDARETTSVPVKEARTQLARLEWRVQAEVLNVKQEEKLVRQIAELEKIVGSSECFFEKRKAFREIIKELDALRKEAQGFHEEMLKHAKESEVYHQAVQDVYKQIKAVEPDYKDINDKLRQAKTEAESAHKLYISEFEKEKGEDAARREMGEKERFSVMRHKADQLMNDFKAGKKLSTEELQIIAGYGE